MANEKTHISRSPGGEAQLMYTSLEQFNRECRRRKQPSIVLAALCVLNFSSVGGIALAIVLILNPVEVQGACLSRDFILFASLMSLVYTVVHIRGARRDYTRKHPGPPQVHGNYLHASALLVARGSIVVWTCGLIATVIMIAKAQRLGELASKVPFLNLLICIVAMPSFVISSCTIERNPTPFATAGVSRASLLTCRVSDFADDLAADQSVSRRASLQRGNERPASAMSIVTADVVRIMKDSSSTRATEINIAGRRKAFLGSMPPNMATSASLPPSLKSSQLEIPRVPTISPPQPAYCPGSWRSEWNNVAEQVGVSNLAEYSEVVSTGPPSTYVSSHYSNASSILPHASVPSSCGTKAPIQRATPSTSITSSAQRSGLSTVRYAEKPDVPVQPVLRVVQSRDNVPPHYSPATVVDSDSETGEATAVPPPRPPNPVALRREAQQAQREISTPRAGLDSALRRRPSHCSKPVPRGARPQDMKVPGAFDPRGQGVVFLGP